MSAPEADEVERRAVWKAISIAFQHGPTCDCRGCSDVFARLRRAAQPVRVGGEDAVEKAAMLALEWFAGFPHSKQDSVSAFTVQTAQIVYDALCDALATASVRADEPTHDSSGNAISPNRGLRAPVRAPLGETNDG